MSMMEMKESFHMNAGSGETSYANNSGLQKVVISKTWSILDETLKDMTKFNGFPKCMRMVDLGCSSGPNTLLLISHIMDTIKEMCRQNNLPIIEVFLNDLPDNDFNNLFKLLPNFYQENEKKRRSECFISGLPGPFYGRLFPSKTLHFAYSSYSLHWLSQIPEGLEKNNENVYMAMTSPPQIFEAYGKQYKKDFSRFLSLRSEEMIPGGRMVLTFIGRSFEDPSSKDVCAIFTLLSKTLLDMVSEGLVNLVDLYSFNVPVYMPCQQEVESIIIDEGSFDLDKMEVYRVPWDANDDNDLAFDKHRSGKLVADCVRAFMQPKLSSHFGSSIVDGVFDRYTKKMADHLSIERSAYFNIAISLSRRSYIK